MAKLKKRKVVKAKVQKVSTHSVVIEEQIEPEKGILLIADIKDYPNDIITVFLEKEVQQAIMCELGTDLFIDKPWKTIPKSILLQEAAKKKKSVFGNYQKVIEDYPFSEILIGYEPFSFGKTDVFLVCVTERGRNRVLKQLKLLRETYVQSVENANSLQPRPWTSFGSEQEIGIDKEVNNRPLISFEWIGNIISRTRGYPNFQPLYADKSKYGYKCVMDTRHTYDLVEKFTSDVACQAAPTINTIESQTIAEIPVNASTQWRPAEEIPVNKGPSSAAENSALAEHIKCFADRMIEVLEYNQNYDLYKDDYQDLSTAGKEFDLMPNLVYKHYITFNDVLQIEGKVITSTSWHPTLTGVVAASYGEDVPCKVEHLDSNSDDTEYEPEETDPEGEIELKEEITDYKTLQEWSEGAEKYDKEFTEVNMEHWSRAMMTLNAIEKSLNLRNYQLDLAIKEEEAMKEMEDMDKVDEFEYIVFEDLYTRLVNKKIALTRKKYYKEKIRRMKRRAQRRIAASKTSTGEITQKKKKKNKKKMKKKQEKKMKKKQEKKMKKKQGKKMKKKQGKKTKKKQDKKMKKKQEKKKKKKSKISRKEMKKKSGKGRKIKDKRKKKMIKKAGSTTLVDNLVKKHPWVEMFLQSDTLKKKHKKKYRHGPLTKGQTVFSVDMNLMPKTNGEKESALKKKQFEQIWGSADKWCLGDEMREAAHRLHRKYYESAIAALGEMPLPTCEEPPIKIEETPAKACKPSLTSGRGSVAYKRKGSLLKPVKKEKKPSVEKIPPGPDYKVITDDEDELNEEELCAADDLYPVLIWSFQNDLAPVLRLDSPYEVRSVSFCPHNGNLVVGGTVTGQLVLWDITDKLKVKDAPEPMDHQAKEAKKIMGKIMKWTRDIRLAQRVPHTAVSSRKDSHKEKVVHLQWLHPCLEISVAGQFSSLAETGPLSMQLITSSEDGSIFFWDLHSLPKSKATGQVVDEKSRRKRFPRPEPLLAPGSPFKPFDRKWAPIFTVYCVDENFSPIQISCVSFEPKQLKYAKVNPTKVKHKMEDIMEYKYVPCPVPPMEKDAFIGTMEGLVGYISWKGSDDKKNAAHSEYAEVNMFQPFHDGPINCLARHPFMPNICLSTGGHMFAVWHTDDLSWPIKWQRYYGVKLTACLWSHLRPSLIRIGRSDGTVEIWDLMLQSHAPKIKIHASGQLITAICSPLLPLPKGLLGVADNNASLRLYYIPWMYQLWTKSELDNLVQFINVEPSRKKKLHEWIINWNHTHVKAGRVAESKKVISHSGHRLRQGQNLEERTQLLRYRSEVYKWYLRRRGKKATWLDDHWKKWYEKEESHMIQTVLANKGWDQKKMNKIIKPVLKLEQLELERKIKVDDLLSQADEIFQAATATIFIDSNTGRKASLVSVKVGCIPMEDIEDAFKEVDLLFGEHYKEIEDEHEQAVNDLKWAKDESIDFILNKYNQLREIFNDRRRWRNPKLKWQRIKIKNEIEKSGCMYSSWESHKDKYFSHRKIKRRMYNMEYLRHLYGENYDPYWDRKITSDDIPLECKESEGKVKQMNNFEKWLELLAGENLEAATQYTVMQKMIARKDSHVKEVQKVSSEVSEDIEPVEILDEQSEKERFSSIEEEESLQSFEELEEGMEESVTDSTTRRSVSFMKYDKYLDFESSEDELESDAHSLTLRGEFKHQSTSSSEEEEEFFEMNPPIRFLPPLRLRPSVISIEEEKPDKPGSSDEEEKEPGTVEEVAQIEEIPLPEKKVSVENTENDHEMDEID